jgi:hypothetical protein
VIKKMRKPVLVIIFLIAVTFLSSCSHVEMQFKPNESMTQRPKKILIGLFENRMSEYNPFIIKNFRDVLKFEFLKQGYDAELISASDLKNADNFTCAENTIEKEQLKDKANSNAANQEAIKRCCVKYASDIFIKGSVSILEAGELTDSKASTFISVMIYNKTGDKIGEAHYSSLGQLDDIKSIKAISKEFAGAINSELNKISQQNGVKKYRSLKDYFSI